MMYSVISFILSLFFFEKEKTLQARNILQYLWQYYYVPGTCYGLGIIAVSKIHGVIYAYHQCVPYCGILCPEWHNYFVCKYIHTQELTLGTVSLPDHCERATLLVSFVFPSLSSPPSSSTFQAIQGGVVFLHNVSYPFLAPHNRILPVHYPIIKHICNFLIYQDLIPSLNFQISQEGDKLFCNYQPPKYLSDLRPQSLFLAHTECLLGGKENLFISVT